MASSKREKELARQRAERQAARRAAAAQRRKQRNAVLASVAAVVLLIGAVAVAALLLRDSSEEDQVAAAQPTETASVAPTEAPSAAPSTSASAAAAGEVACTYEPTGEPAKPAPLPPTENVENEQVYEVTLATDRGDIVVEVDSAAAPCTVNSLTSLAAAGYFDATPCHRLTTEGIEVLQCGDPTGTGSGGPGYQFADENLEGAQYPRGTVAMANAGPGTNGSQFFLVYGDSQLPPNYTPFGEITSGLEVIDEVAAAGSQPEGDGTPNQPVTIETLRAEPVAG